MPRVITIDPGKSKCGLVLAEVSEKKVYKAIILKSELIENYVRNLIAAEDISQIIIGNGTTSGEIREKLYFFKKEINILDITDNGIADNTQLFNVPENHFFVMGDNRDNSQDSRFIGTVGFIPYENLVGKAKFLFFSNDQSIGNFFTFWRWHNSIRFNRILKKII